MNITRLNIRLDKYNIGLSGAIPERKDWNEAAMDRSILEFIALLSGIVFKYGGRIVHGCHPSFTPIILRQARLHAKQQGRKPVTLVMSDLWARDIASSDLDAMRDVADFIITSRVGEGGPEDVKTRNDSLSLMRQTLIKEQNIMVAVGGKMHSEDGVVPGVAEEMKLATEHKIPQFLVGGMGGYAKALTGELTPSSLNNGLSQEENVLLFGTNDISACVNLIFKQLSSDTLQIQKKVRKSPRV